MIGKEIHLEPCVTCDKPYCGACFRASPQRAIVQKVGTGLLFVATLLSALACSLRGQAPLQNATVGLGGTAWQLVKFQGSDDKTLTPDDESKYTIIFGTDGGVSMRIDCNRGRGTWESSGPNQLEFGPLALTRAMCAAAPLNDRIAKDWQYVRSYILKNGHLFLSLMADGGIYEFEPVSPGGLAVGSVKGTATYRERMALPPTAVFVAILEDVSTADAPAEVIGRARIEHPGNPPIPFEIVYDPSRINPSHRYGVRARILVDGKLFFTTDQHYPVFTAAQSNEVALLLRRADTSTPPNGSAETSASQSAASGGTATASLENTYWKLTLLGDKSIQIASRQQEPHFVLTSESHRVNGSGGCNRMMGSYELNGDQLTFSQMGSTMMACIEGMETEKAFLDVLKQVNSWKVMGQQLELFDAAGNLLATFEARYLKSNK